MTTSEIPRAAAAMSSRLRRTPARRHSAGFSLLELMVVVVVIAIIAAIAYPNYRESVLKSRRGQAKADLVEMAQILERRHTVENAYPDEIPNLSDSSALEHYEFELEVAAGGQAFTLTAEPSDGQAEDACGTLSLTSTGQKGHSSGEFADCW